MVFCVRSLAKICPHTRIRFFRFRKRSSFPRRSQKSVVSILEERFGFNKIFCAKEASSKILQISPRRNFSISNNIIEIILIFQTPCVNSNQTPYSDQQSYTTSVHHIVKCCFAWTKVINWAYHQKTCFVF